MHSTNIPTYHVTCCIHFSLLYQLNFHPFCDVLFCACTSSYSTHVTYFDTFHPHVFQFLSAAFIHCELWSSPTIIT